MNQGFGFEPRPLPPELKARLATRAAERRRLAKEKRERMRKWSREHTLSGHWRENP